MATKKPTALGGDIFAGLFTRGILDAGFEVLGHLEHTTYGTPTARLNYPDLDIRNGTHAWRPHDFRKKVDFLYSNPPCAAWSAMQVTKPWQEYEDRLQIVRDLVVAGQIVEPKAWCWESVMGAWNRGQEFVLEQARSWLAYGYHVTVLLQNNMWLGTSQNRPRMFLIAHKHPLIWPAFEEPRTLDELLRALPKGLKTSMHHPPLAPSLKQLWAESVDHGNALYRALLAHSEREQAQLRPRPAMTMSRMRGNQVPGTFIGASKRLHPRSPRTLNWFECLAVAGLPLDWRSAHDNLEPASLELSRAVMPGVGKWLGTAVKAGLTEPALNRRRVQLRVVDVRDPRAVTTEVIEELRLTAGRPTVPDWNPPMPAVRPERLAACPAKPRLGGPTKPGVGARTRELLEKGLGTKEVLTVIHDEFPGTKATAADVSWNRRKLRELKGER